MSPPNDKIVAEHLDAFPLDDVADGDEKHPVPTVAHTKNVYNAALYEAIQEADIKTTSKSTLHLFFSVFIALCCSFINGYDGSLLTGILAMPHFQATFGTTTTGSKVSLLASLYTVGHMVGSPFGAWISDRWGRRAGMASGCVIIVVGMIIVVSSNNIVQFAVGRFILGFGYTLSTVAAPAYVMEIAPPQWRGRCTGLYNCGWYAGNVPAGIINYGTNFIDSDWSWRIPLVVQAAAAFVVLGGVWFIPESPRWQMLNGQPDAALAFLTVYHGSGNAESKLVQLEYTEFKENIKTDGADKRWWDYRVLYDTHNHRWRTLQVIMMGIAGQYSGNGLAYFNTVVYANLGVSAVSDQLAYNVGSSIVSATGAVCGGFLTDKMPRRLVLVYGTFFCACWLALNAGLQSALHSQGANASPSLAKGALAAYFLFGFFFMFCYTPLQAVVPAEALESSMRAKGLALNGLITGAMGFINQFCGPIALGNIGYQYVYVFVAWDTVEAAAWYFYGVEAQGRTLEELEWVYDQPNPVKTSLNRDRVVVQDDGTVRAATGA